MKTIPQTLEALDAWIADQKDALELCASDAELRQFCEYRISHLRTMRQVLATEGQDAALTMANLLVKAGQDDPDLHIPSFTGRQVGRMIHEAFIEERCAC